MLDVFYRNENECIIAIFIKCINIYIRIVGDVFSIFFASIF